MGARGKIYHPLGAHYITVGISATRHNARRQSGQNDKSAGGMLRRFSLRVSKRSGDAIGSFAAFGLEGLDLEPQPFAQGSGDKPADAVRLPAGCAHEVL